MRNGYDPMRNDSMIYELHGGDTGQDVNGLPQSEAAQD